MQMKKQLDVDFIDKNIVSEIYRYLDNQIDKQINKYGYKNRKMNRQIDIQVDR